jgi:type II secretory ATPase GspE/PulE/Tfp pilus assembly ATPase PilB-like protein
MAEDSSYHVTIRRMGTMETIAVVPKELGVLMVNLVKSNAGMDLAEKRRPLDGRWHHEVNGQTIHFRINSIGTLHGEDVTLRLLNRRSGLLSMERLGLIPSQLADIRGMLASSGGLILVTGPTGGGKTTTLYACLQQLNDGTRKINTLEDPIEYALPGVRQSQVNPRMGLSFSELLRGTLRQNPDVIMVGEIRDEETATTAVRAANSGHLVISTLHAPMATSAVHALLAYNVHPFFLANSLLGVVAQRLVRVLSDKTRIAYDISHAPETFSEVKSLLAPGQGHVIYGPDAADPHAHQGYTAQTGLFEVLPVNQELREMVAAARPSSELRKRAIELGMLDFHRAGLLKVAQGVTSIEEVVRNLPNESLEAQNWYRRPE